MVILFFLLPTSRASDAAYSNFDIPTRECRTDRMLPDPNTVIVRIKLDLRVVAMEEMEMKSERHMMKVQQDMLLQLHGYCPPNKLPPQAKRIKQEIDSKVNSVLSMPERPVTIKPDENSRTQHILEQITDYVKQNKLELFNNKSTISHYGKHQFSKYSTSKPDIVVISRDK